MDCEYMLICKWGDTEIQRQFNASAPANAEEQAWRIIQIYQVENIRIFPYMPQIVEAQLYRCYKELSGADIIDGIRQKKNPQPSIP